MHIYECLAKEHLMSIREQDQTCEQCGITHRKRVKRQFCSRECSAASRKKPPKTCEHCGKQYMPSRRTTQRYCSNTCSKWAMHGSPSDGSGKIRVRVCNNCGKDFEVKKAGKIEGRAYYRVTCSDQCEFERRSKTHKGKIVSPETRAKISESKSGVNSPFYIDGRAMDRSAEYYEEYGGKFTHRLKNLIKERDGHKCLKCGHDGSEFLLHVHHIDMDKMNNDESNLATVCGSCHTRIHAGSLDNNFVIQMTGKDAKK